MKPSEVEKENRYFHLYAQTVASDFDGVIHKYSKGWHDGTIYDEPNEGTKEALDFLMEKYAVYIHTTRSAPHVAMWMENHFKWPVVPETHLDEATRSLPFWNTMGTILITPRKLPAIAYIDDRGIRFSNWTDALSDLHRLT